MAQRRPLSTPHPIPPGLYVECLECHTFTPPQPENPADTPCPVCAADGEDSHQTHYVEVGPPCTTVDCRAKVHDFGLGQHVVTVVVSG